MLAIKNFLIFLLVCVACVGLAGFAGVALADVPVTPGITLTNPLVGVNSFTDLFTKISDYILTVIAALATLMFVWAGILYVTSSGNPGQIAKAHKAVMYAIIGVAIALAGKGLIQVIAAIIGSPPTP